MLTAVHIVPQNRLEQLELFEVAPEIMVAAKPRTVKAPRTGIVKWEPSPSGDGSFLPMVETHPAIINLRRWSEQLYGVSRDTIAALVDAGFVDGERPAPRTMLINLESWFAHRARVRENPAFWLDDGRRARFTEMLKRRHRHPGKQGRNSNRHSSPSEAPAPESAVLTLKSAPDAPNGAARGRETKPAATRNRATA